MKFERAKPQILPGAVTPSKKQIEAQATPLQAKAATPAQLKRAKNKLKQDRALIQRQAKQASGERQTRTENQERVRVQGLQNQAVAQEQQARVQRLAETQARQQSFFSSFVKSPIQRQFQAQIKNSNVQTAQARDQYQTAVQPEILQRLVDNQMSLQAKTAQAAQSPNALNARAEWFNSELPVLRAQHNRPDTPFLDGVHVFKPTDQQSFALGKTYAAQRLSDGLTPKDAANAVLNIQHKADRDLALKGLLTGVNPRSSEYASIQRLVAEKEHDLEVQRQALFQDDGLQARAFQLAKEEANPTKPNSGISEKIKAKLGGGKPLPEHVRRQLEAGLNVSLELVRVHTDGEADFLSKSVQAKAFTTGNDIFFSSGAFDPNTKSGFELIAHETTHTLQQASGQVQPGIDSDPNLETAAQTKGAELASGFDPNFKFKNLENQAQPNSPLIASQPPAHRAKIQAMQRSSLNVQREPQSASLIIAPTVSVTLDESALATLTTALLPVVPQKYQTDAQINIPVILRQCFSSQIKNANQVAYILATAQHESRFGTKMYSRSESLVEDHNPLKTEHKKVKDPTTKKTHVEDIPYRSNHVTGNRVNADPSNTDNLDTYYDDAYGAKLGNVKGSSDAANYRGRGFVQITGRDNYKRLGTQLQNEGFTYAYNNQTYGGKEQPIDLVANPTHVNLVPELAAKIMVSGMQNDSFSQGGKGLSTYVNDKTSDFVGARGLVNGTDRAADIAKIAEDFAKILNTDNAWGKLFLAPDLTKQAPDMTKPGVTPNQVLQRSSLSLQREQGLPETLTPQGRADGAVLIASAAKGKFEKESIENAKVPINKSVNSRKKLQIEVLVFYGFDRTLAETYTNTDGDFDYRNVNRNITNWREPTQEEIKAGFMIVVVSDAKKLREKAKLANVQFTANPRNAPLPGLAVAIDNTGVKLREKPGTNGKEIHHYPFKSQFFVEEVAGAPTWFKARATDGKEGYVAMHLIRVAPEVGSTLYEIKPGQSISNIVASHYDLRDKLNAPERHKIIAALSYLNPALLQKPSQGAGWDKVVTLPGLIWLPSKNFIGTLRGFNINDSIGGDFTDGATSVVKAGMDTLAETSEYVVKNVLKQFPGGQRVMDKLGEIGTGVSAIYNNPGRFVDTLCKSVNDGFGLFTKNLPENLQNSAIGVITGSLSGTGLVLPKTLDATGFLDIGLQVLGVSPQQLENKIAKNVPGGLQAIRAVGEAKDVFDGIRNNGVLATIKSYYENSEGIQQVIINGLKSWTINTVAKKAIAVLGSLFIPGGGLVQLAIKIYDTITFVLDKMEMISKTLASITKSFASIANGDASQATTGIVETLKDGLTLALGFMVKISGLGGITDKVKKLLKDLRTPVDKAIANLIKFIKGKLSKTTKPAPTGTPDTATGTGKAPKSLSAFKQFATKFGAKPSRITAFTDDKTSDDKHDGDVATGIKYLQAIEKTKLEGLKGDASFTLDTAREVAKQTKSNNKVFKDVNVVQNGLGFNYRLIASETIITAIDPAKVAAHLEDLKSDPIPSLEELKKIESGVDERYVTDFEIRENAGLNKQDFRAYIGGRASRKLGKSGETDSIALYNKAIGRNAAKNNTTYIVKDRDGKELGKAIPDFFIPGVAVGDIKDVKRQDNEPQMKAIALIAKGNGVSKENGEVVDTGGSIAFDLVVRKSTIVSKPLADAIGESNGGEVYKILEDKE